MSIEKFRSVSCGDDEVDEFPKGMRVLAVDDDPTCLKILDALLRKCQYNVTTTSEARTALNMLRENRNRFDLIISDVYMPDMDGFKLLELVGLEMDLPVIMLSANSDPKLVMKGITHGACDYLVKPVRVEELRNIWQHVVRKKKVIPKLGDRSKSDDRDQQGSEGGQGPSLIGNVDQNGKINRKRKDEEEEGEGEENDHDDDDESSTQKKPRVVWSIDLHGKFVEAVNQLGVEKAVPKRILDLMNVEGLTRENVASHLQKYRLYLKKVSSEAAQQASMVNALVGKDASYLRMGTIDQLGGFRSLAGSERFSTTGLSSYATSGMLGRLNSPVGVSSLRGLTSSAVNQPSHAQNLCNSINALGKFRSYVSPALRNPNFCQDITSSFEFDQFQQNKSTALPMDNHINFAASNTSADSGVSGGNLSNLLTAGLNNPLMLQGQGNSQQTQNGVGFSNQSSLKMAPFNSGSFNIGGGGGQNGFELSKFSTNPLTLTEPYNNSQLSPTSLISNNSSPSAQIQNSPVNFSSSFAFTTPLEDSRGDQGSLFSTIIPNANQELRHQQQDFTHKADDTFSTLNSVAPFSQSMDHNGGGYNQWMEASLAGLVDGAASTLLQQHETDKSIMNLKLRSNEGCLMEQINSQGRLVPNNYDSFDDLVKRDFDGTMLMDGEIGFDGYPF